MLSLLTIVTSIVGILLMGAILIQNPKGGGIDSAMGGQVSNQLFGAAQSTDIVEKWTWYLAAALFVLCIIASVMAGGMTTAAPVQ